MIWKIFFVLFALLFAFLQVDGITSTLPLTEVNLALGYVLGAVYILIAGWFFALGWKKKLYSLKANNIVLTAIILLILLSTGLALSAMMPSLMIQTAGDADHTRYLGGIVILSVISFSIYSLMYSPAIAAYFKYKKYYHEMTDVKRPYWKLFLTYMAVTCVINAIYILFKSFGQNFNFWDWFTLLTIVIDVMFMIGYAYNIKFGKQIFWKIIAIPYIFISVISVFLSSDDFMKISRSYLIKESYVVMAGTIIVSAATFYALYRYAFSTDVYAENTEKISEVSEN